MTLADQPRDLGAKTKSNWSLPTEFAK